MPRKLLRETRLPLPIPTRTTGPDPDLRHGRSASSKIITDRRCASSTSAQRRQPHFPTGDHHQEARARCATFGETCGPAMSGPRKIRARRNEGDYTHNKIGRRRHPPRNFSISYRPGITEASGDRTAGGLPLHRWSRCRTSTTQLPRLDSRDTFSRRRLHGFQDGLQMSGSPVLMIP